MTKFLFVEAASKRYHHHTYHFLHIAIEDGGESLCGKVITKRLETTVSAALHTSFMGYRICATCHEQYDQRRIHKADL